MQKKYSVVDVSKGLTMRVIEDGHPRPSSRDRRIYCCSVSYLFVCPPLMTSYDITFHSQSSCWVVNLYDNGLFKSTINHSGIRVNAIWANIRCKVKSLLQSCKLTSKHENTIPDHDPRHCFELRERTVAATCSEGTTKLGDSLDRAMLK